VIFVFMIVLLFASSYSSIQKIGQGYLTYGQCGDSFEPGRIGTDPYISEDYFYFSAVTFFTVGYGDICPMGWNKYVALLNAFVGNFISVVVMVFVIGTYMKRTNNG
jgi:Ion channel